MKSNTLKDPAATGKVIRQVGLDVHKDTIAVAVAEGIAEPYFLKRISHDLHAVEKLVGELREGGRYQLRVCYEAGPTGFVLARRLQAWGIECLVISPSHVPKGSADKVKTDKRDALKLATSAAAGKTNRHAAGDDSWVLTSWVPIATSTSSRCHQRCVPRSHSRGDARFSGLQGNGSQTEVRMCVALASKAGIRILEHNTEGFKSWACTQNCPEL